MSERPPAVVADVAPQGQAQTEKGAQPPPVVTRWGRVWPALLAVAVVGSVGTPAAVASYRHAKDVVISTGDLAMAPWLPLSVDGMLLAALVVMWVRRHRGEKVGKGPWAAFIFGMVVTVAANLEAVNIHPTPLGPPDATDYIVALFPPLALAIALELVALVAKRTAPADAVPGHVPAVPADAVPGPVPAVVTALVPGLEHESVTEVVPGPVPDFVPGPVPDFVPAVPGPETEVVPGPVPDFVPGPVPGPVPAVTAADLGSHDGGAGTDDAAVTDEEVLAWLLNRATEDRVVPSRRAVRDRFPVGAGRADKLRAQTAVPARMRRVK